MFVSLRKLVPMQYTRPPQMPSEWVKDAENAKISINGNDIETANGDKKVFLKLKPAIVDIATDRLASTGFVWFPDTKSVLKNYTTPSLLCDTARALQTMATWQIGLKLTEKFPGLIDLEKGKILAPAPHYYQNRILNRADNVKPHVDGKFHNKIVSIGYSPVSGLITPGKLVIWNISNCTHFDKEDFFTGPGITFKYLPDIEKVVPSGQDPSQYPFFILIDGGRGEKKVAHSVSGTRVKDPNFYRREVHKVILHQWDIDTNESLGGIKIGDSICKLKDLI